MRGREYVQGLLDHVRHQMRETRPSGDAEKHAQLEAEELDLLAELERDHTEKPAEVDLTDPASWDKSSTDKPAATRRQRY